MLLTFGFDLNIVLLNRQSLTQSYGTEDNALLCR